MAKAANAILPFNFVQVGNTAGMGDLGDCIWWKGDFSGSGWDEILLYCWLDNNWFLGRFADNLFSFGGGPIGNSLGLGANLQGFLFFRGDFLQAGKDQLLYYHTPDKNWVLMSVDGGLLNYGVIGNQNIDNLYTTSASESFTGCPAIVGNFTSKDNVQILQYNRFSFTWSLATI
jgi:hypothetical protein